MTVVSVEVVYLISNNCDPFLPSQFLISAVFYISGILYDLKTLYTLNSAYNKVAFNEKSAITKENLCTKYTPLTYKYIALNGKPPITKQNLHIFFFIIGRVECTSSLKFYNFLYSSSMFQSNVGYFIIYPILGPMLCLVLIFSLAIFSSMSDCF